MIDVMNKFVFKEVYGNYLCFKLNTRFRLVPSFPDYQWQKNSVFQVNRDARPSFPKNVLRNLNRNFVLPTARVFMAITPVSLMS
jgi:hypothetical protein